MIKCKICDGLLESIGSVQFDRNNAEVTPTSDIYMEYYKCSGCGAICCPTMLDWTPEELGRVVYNQDYVKYDTEYVTIRPHNYAKFFRDYCNTNKFRHLDYGSGTGAMSTKLKEYGGNSTAYDPYSNNILPEGKFKVITAIEVVEHSLDVEKTFQDMLTYLDKNGVIIFSTLLADEICDINWWYIGARNGHINIQSKQSLKTIAIKNGLYFGSINTNIHVLQANRNDCKNLLGIEVSR